MVKRPIIPVIVGPTAVGKSSLALALARRFGAEIVSADSRQIYRYMNIGTAKPTSAELAEIHHHFVDIVDPDETYDAGRYGLEARAVISGLLSQSRRIVVVGGSGLYVRSLTDGFFEGAMKDDAIRDAIRRRIEREGSVRVYETLKGLDPEAAARIHPNDARRIERALEVYQITGCPLSELQKSAPPKLDFEPLLVGLDCERSALYRRIEERVDRMIHDGLIEETEDLLRRGYSETLVSMESLGYREIIAYLKGQLARGRMIELFKQGSRNYAKRQWTWFRKDLRIKWFSGQWEPEITAIMNDRWEGSP